MPRITENSIFTIELNQDEFNILMNGIEQILAEAQKAGFNKLKLDNETIDIFELILNQTNKNE